MRVALVYHGPQTSVRLDDAFALADAEVERFHLESGDPVPGHRLRPGNILGGAWVPMTSTSIPGSMPKRNGFATWSGPASRCSVSALAAS